MRYALGGGFGKAAPDWIKKQNRNLAELGERGKYILKYGIV